METLFVLDRGDYTADMQIMERWCVRALIRDNEGRLLVQKSRIGEYKLPGGGVEKGETRISTLQREVEEETGYGILPGSIREIGEVIEKRADVYQIDKIYLNHTCFYSCEINGEQKELSLTPEEKARGYAAVWETPENIVKENDALQKDYWRRRDTLFLKWLDER